MIKINKRHEASFVQDYVDYSIREVVLPRLMTLTRGAPAEVKRRLLNHFNERYLRALVVIEPKDIESTIENVTRAFPELAEYYCPALIFAGLDLPYHEIPKSAAGQVDKDSVERLACAAVIELNKVKAGRSLTYTDMVIASLASGIPPSRKRRVLMRLQAANGGGYKLSPKERRVFPAWIRDFASCFDYDKIAGKFGRVICNRLELSVCPYCAIEDLSIPEADSSHAELDHFYPRSRFPYLAISLNNLIPAGSTCNQKSKRNHPMLSHAHPFVQGMGGESLFIFDYLTDGNKVTDLKIELKSQAVKRNNLNIERFRLGEKYKKFEETACWFSNAFAMKSFLRQIGRSPSDAEVKEIPFIESELTRTSNKVVAQQFKIEAVNKIFETEFKIVHQKP